MKAIDLYSGIGGWALGLELNGIKVINSYEWWDQAVETANKNLGKTEVAQDIRQMDFSELKGKKIDIVVGSPPCTQFSYSNRGGSGDIDEGIIDLYKFFECVHKVKPKFWAMENVPRVKGVLENEIKQGGQLYKFRNIISDGFIEIINFSEFGLPQKRRRCIASNANLELLNSYKERLKTKTLGDVLVSLSTKNILDINYKISLPKSQVTDLENEEILNPNEVRMNKEMKTNHPVYNNMSFPEKLDCPARTITATCTRVSRESLVVKKRKGFRRLSVRERGVIQGFPINYQFLGNSYSQKIKMIGNAIPPVFTYAIASAFLEKSKEDFKPMHNISFKSQSKEKSPKTKTDVAGNKFKSNRSFRFAIPTLRFKSGTSFELSNKSNVYRLLFFYGDSKNIKSLTLDVNSFDFFAKNVNKKVLRDISNLNQDLKNVTSESLQNVWVGQTKGISPFEFIDYVNDYADLVYQDIVDTDDQKLVEDLEAFYQIKASPKIKQNIYRILSGLVICSYVNSKILYKS